MAMIRDRLGHGYFRAVFTRIAHTVEIAHRAVDTIHRRLTKLRFALTVATEAIVRAALRILTRLTHAIEIADHAIGAVHGRFTVLGFALTVATEAIARAALR